MPYRTCILLSSQSILIVETKEVGLDKVTINLQDQMNSVSKHIEDIFLTCKTSIPSIVNTLNKTDIPIYVYETYAEIFYGESHIKALNLNFKYFVEQHLK